jgi:hypothetical protein
VKVEGKIIQFQVIHKDEDKGETIYVLTDEGKLYYYATGGSSGWTLVY